MAYGPFGTVVSNNGVSPNRLKYTGREDDGTGLYYYRARYYDASIGRFISEDPLQFAAGINHYAYVDNNPVNANDPSGENPVTKFIRESAEYLGVRATAAAMQATKDRAVDAAWRMEIQLVQDTGRGSRFWTPEELALLQQRKPVPGYAGHHINSANASPHLAGNPDNIKFLSGAEHKVLHSAAGGTQAPTYGPLIDRTAGGTLPRLADAQGYSIKGALLGAGAAVLGGVASVAEAVEVFDPWTYILHVGGAGAPGDDFVPRTPTPGYFPTGAGGQGAAGGGFLLYPNKANTNMMRSVYSK